MPPRPSGRPGLAVVTVAGRSGLYVRGTIRGKRVYQSAGTDDPDLAEEFRATLEARLYREEVHGAPTVSHTFAEACLGYHRDRKPSKGTQLRITRLLRAYGPRMACDALDQEAVDQAALVILRHGYAPATKLREVVTPTRAVLQWAAGRKWCGIPAFERGDAGKARTAWKTPTEVEAQIAAASSHLRPLLEFLYGTGARLSEAVDLDWSDMDLPHASATLRTKNGNFRRVDLIPRVVVALAGIEARDGRVFRRPDGEPYADRERLGGGQIKVAWGTACRAAGWPGVEKVYERKDRPGKTYRRFDADQTPHVTRHTWATWHYAVHRDLIMLRTEGDWSTTSLVERYAHLAPRGVVPAIKAFNSAGAVLVHGSGARKETA